MSEKYVITIDADTLDALTKLKQVGAEAKAAAKDQKEAAEKSSEGWKSFKNVLGALGIIDLYKGIGAAAQAAFKASVTSARDLESGLAKIQTLLDGSADAQKLFTQDILDLQRNFGTDQKDSLEAYYDALSSGAVDAAGASELMTSANKLAIGGVTTLAIASDGLTSVLAAYGLQVEESTRVSDVFFIGAKIGKTSIQDLASNIGQVAPIANNLNVSLEELVGSISAITITGVSTSEAVTQVRAALTGLTNQTPEMVKSLRSIGVESIQAGIANFGFEGILKKLIGTTDGTAESLSALFGRTEAVLGVTTLTSDAIGGKFRDALKEMEVASKSAGQVTEKAFTTIADTTEFRMNAELGKTKAAMTELGTTINGSVVPAGLAIAKAFNSFVLVPTVQWLRDNSEELKLVGIGLLGGAAAAGTFALAANGAALAAKAFWLAVNPITLLVTLSGAAIYATTKYVDELSLSFLNLADNVGAVGSVIPGLGNSMAELREFAQSTAVAIQKSIDAKEADRLKTLELSYVTSDAAYTAAKAAQDEADARASASAQIEETATKTSALAKKLTDEELKAAKDHEKALSDVRLQARIQEAERKIVDGEASTIENESRLQLLIEQLGREDGIKAEARLRTLEAEKKTIENTRALQLVREQILVDGFKRQASEQEKVNNGQLTTEQEQAKKLAEIRKKAADEERKARDGELLYFMNQKDNEADFAAKTERQKLDTARGGFATLAGLSLDGNKTLGEIGKSAAIAGATIDTYKAATGAYASLAGIPIVGPALGAAAAAAAVVAGLANVRAIGAQRFERGGIVQGSSFTGDNIGVRVNSGELILNRAQQKNLAPQLGGQSMDEVVYVLNGVRADIQNLKLIIGDEDIFSAVIRQKESGRQI